MNNILYDTIFKFLNNGEGNGTTILKYIKIRDDIFMMNHIESIIEWGNTTIKYKYDREYLVKKIKDSFDIKKISHNSDQRHLLDEVNKTIIDGGKCPGFCNRFTTMEEDFGGD